MNYNQAYERVNQLKKFYKSLTWFGIITAFIFFNNFFEKGKIEFSLFDGLGIMAIWAIFLTVKAFKLFVFNSDWEREMLDKELEKEKTGKF